MLKLFLSLLQIIIQIIILSYIFKLEKEKCECSKNIKRDIIKYVSIFGISFLILRIFLKIDMLNDNTIYFLNIIGIVNLVCTIWYYINILNDTNCLCSKLWYRHFLLGPIILQIILIIYILLGVNKYIKMPYEIKMNKHFKELKKMNNI